MLFLFIALGLIALISFPQLWIRYVMKKHQVTREDIKGTGEQFAQHLLKRLALNDVKLECCEPGSGDHYDPRDKTVRLSPIHFNERNLAAIVIAAHEIGHAMQDAEDHPLMRRRETLAKAVAVIETIAPIALTLSPILFAISKSPVLSIAMFALGALSISMNCLFHLITLPVELDASFNKAMPLLIDGQYLSEPDLIEARTLLRAAAFTYIAQSLVNLLNIGYWLTRLKRF